MRKKSALNIALLAALLMALGLLMVNPLLASSLSSKPGGSHPVLGGLELSDEQQQQIRNLRSAFRDQVNALDWSVENGAHSPQTLRQARELRMALRAEVREVLTEEQRQAMDAARRGSCPHSGRVAPVRTQQRTSTLFL